jgi:hypothetical protein
MTTASGVQLTGRGTGVLAADPSPQAQGLSITCYENEVPAFAGPEIDRLYGHLYCSLSYFEIARQLAGASTYVVSRGKTPVTLLLFKRHAGQVSVIGEFLPLDQEEIRRFSDYMFSTFKSVKAVTFDRVQSDLHHLPRPWHAVNVTEDMVVTLPVTVKEYEAGVGKNMRRNIKRYTSTLQRDFPSYAYKIYLGAEVSEQIVRDIIKLSCMRMESKNIVPRFDEEETQWIVNFAKTHGLVGVATIDGRVCAGAIGFRIGQNYFMHVIAHDPKYNDYSLGILCYYHTICEGIARGGQRFHLLQGRYGYKVRLLAERRDIRHIDVYRSRVQAILHGPRIGKKAVKGYIHEVTQWLLHDVEHSDADLLRRIGRLVHALRSWRRSRGRAGKNWW